MLPQVDEDYIFGKPTKEEEEPLDVSSVHDVDPLTATQLQIGERDKNRKDRRYYSAFRLIIGCLIMLGIVYIIDVVTSIMVKGELSHITDEIVEVIKTLLFVLSGYLFGKKEHVE